jgi:hypothetical protein
MTQTHSVWCNKHHFDTIQTRKVHRVSTSAGTGDVSNDIISEHKYLSISISISVASTWYRHTKLDATSINMTQYRPKKSTTWASTGYVSNNIISEYKYISISISLTSTWCRHTQCDATSISWYSRYQKSSHCTNMSQWRQCELKYHQWAQVHIYEHKSGINMIQTHSVWCNRHHSDAV